VALPQCCGNDIVSPESTYTTSLAIDIGLL